MEGSHTSRSTCKKTAWILALCLCLFASAALADGMMPMMPKPPSTPVYWQLTSIAEEPSVTPSGGYAVEYGVQGLSLDLTDGLLTESLLESGDALWPSATLSISKDGAAMRHTYRWTSMPVYLEPGVTYPVEVSGSVEEEAGSLNSMLGVYIQGDMVKRISAGGYTGHAEAMTFEIGTDSNLYNDGSLVVSFILRDVNDMFRLRVAYTYTMVDGAKPVPTPIPGFVAVEAPDGVVPSYYDAVEGRDGLWRVTTAPDQYRAYGSMSGSEPMFFPADADGNVVMNETPADPRQDYEAFVKGFVPVELETLPPKFFVKEPGVYAFIARDGEIITRAYGRMDGGEPAFYAADDTGAVDADAQPIDPEADFETYIAGFGAAEPDAAVPHYEILPNGVYAFTGRDGVTRYRVYGRLDGEAPAYYEADAEGNPVERAAPVLPEADFETYIKGFDSAVPGSLPAYYEVVRDGVYGVTDRTGETYLRVYGVLDGAAPAFYPADAEGNLAEGAAPIDPADDFDRYIAGFDPVDQPDAPVCYGETNVPGVWSFEDIDGNTHYRVYGELNRGEAAYYPSDAEGNVAVDALPVDPAADLTIMPAPKFAAVTPEAAIVPPYYEVVEGVEGLYTFTDREGEPVYRVYGAYGRAAPVFYPADAAGVPIEDAEAVTPEHDFRDYFEGFVPMMPAAAPAFYKVVEGAEGLYAFENRDGQTVYRVYGSIDRGAPGFYPSDAVGIPTSGDAVDPETDIQMLPTPLLQSVITPGPETGADQTPVARTEAWETVSPESTLYASSVLPSGTPLEKGAAIGRTVTAEPASTGYTADVLPPVTTKDSLPAVDRTVTAEPAGTGYTADVLPPVTTEGNLPAVDRTTTAEPASTGYIANVAPTDGSGAETSPAVTHFSIPSPESSPTSQNTAYAATILQDPEKAGEQEVVARISEWASVDLTPEPGQGTPAQTGTDPTEGPVETGHATATQTVEGTPTVMQLVKLPDEATAEPTEEATEAPAAGPTEAPVEPEPEGTPAAVWIAVAALGVAVVGGGGYWFIRRKKK